MLKTELLGLHRFFLLYIVSSDKFFRAIVVQIMDGVSVGALLDQVSAQVCVFSCEMLYLKAMKHSSLALSRKKIQIV